MGLACRGRCGRQLPTTKGSFPPSHATTSESGKEDEKKENRLVAKKSRRPFLFSST